MDGICACLAASNIGLFTTDDSTDVMEVIVWDAEPNTVTVGEWFNAMEDSATSASNRKAIGDNNNYSDC
jgi:hypothetical protein